jgi:hypothetical protein
LGLSCTMSIWSSARSGRNQLIACTVLGLWGSLSANAEAESHSTLDGVVGWRVDRASLGVCAELADGASYGYGLSKFRSVNVAQFGVQGETALSTHWRGNASILYGYVANGHVVDSGLSDLNSNPFNARSWAYATCCTPKSCVVEPPCDCECPDLTYRSLALTTARLRGATWDVLASATYDFRPCEDWRLGLGVTWELNWQRFRYDQSIWGPIVATLTGADCLSTLGANFITTDLDGTEHFALGGPNVLATVIGNTPIPGTSKGTGCLALGYCFNGNTYRSSWNMGMGAAEINWAVTRHWDVNLLYRIGFGAYSGKFETLDGVNGENTSCDLCPAFLAICGTDLNDLDVSATAFQPSTMRIRAPAFGQEVRLTGTYSCCCWNAGIDVAYYSRRTMSCTDVDPCRSCASICNGGLDVGSSSVRPIWANATLARASWNSVQVQLFAGWFF